MIHFEDYEREALKDQIYMKDFEEIILLEGEAGEILGEPVKIQVKDEEVIQDRLLPF